MGSVRKREGRWQARYRDPDGRQRGRTFATQTEARRFLAMVTTEMARGDWIDPAAGRVLVSEWMEVWSGARVVGPSSAKQTPSLLKHHLTPYLGHLPIAGLTAMTVRGWVAQLVADGAGPATITKVYGLLSSAMNAAVEEQLIRATPCRGVRLPRRPADKRRFLSESEIAPLLEEIPERYYAPVLLAYTTGLRWGELAGLRRRHLDLLRRQVHVVESLKEVAGSYSWGSPKSAASSRVVSLPQVTVDAVAAHLAEWPVRDLDGPVFTGPNGGLLSRNRFRQRVWLPALERASARAWQATVDAERAELEYAGIRGLELERLVTRFGKELDDKTLIGVRFHDLRHSHVATLISNGTSPKKIQARLGHASIRITFDLYGHLLEDVEETMMAGLEQRFSTLAKGAGAALRSK